MPFYLTIDDFCFENNELWRLKQTRSKLSFRKSIMTSYLKNFEMYCKNIATFETCVLDLVNIPIYSQFILKFGKFHPQTIVAKRVGTLTQFHEI